MIRVLVWQLAGVSLAAVILLSAAAGIVLVGVPLWIDRWRLRTRLRALEAKVVAGAATARAAPGGGRGGGGPPRPRPDAGGAGMVGRSARRGGRARPRRRMLRAFREPSWRSSR